jgi:ATP-dependent DNA ligase
MDLLIPMLAEALPASKLEKLLVDDRWAAETKVDGERLLVHVDDGKVIPVNRKGAITTLPSKAIANAFATLSTGPWVFDGEVVNYKFHVWDMPMAGTAITPSAPYEQRRAVLEAFMSRWDMGGEIHLLPSYRGEEAKRDLLRRMQEHNGEGIMLKDLTAPYISGKRSDKIKKYKMWKSVDVIITEIRREGKDNAAMALICPDRGVVEVGTISTIGKGSVQPGDVFEAKFLYAVDRSRPRLYQPTLLRKRLDKSPEECTLDQLDTCYTNKTVLDL